VLQDQYKNLPGVEYHHIKCDSRIHTYVKKEIQIGVLPTLEKNLLNARKTVKKQMKTEENKDVYAMLDAKQLAIKVSCNSVYGFTGAENGLYPEPKIAESITSTGRTMIERTRQYILENIEKSEVLYGDTDSVMIKFNVPPTKESIKTCFELGKRVAEKVSQLFGEAVSLEMEKVYFPYLLFGKKRYVALKYEDPEKIKGLDSKGIELVRRDWSTLVRNLYSQCVQKVFYDRDVEGAKTLVKQYCQDMIDNKLNPDMFIMSKELKSHYANPDGQLHMAVVKKIAQRTPGSEPQPGDRVPFVVIKTRSSSSKISDQTEDPSYAKQHNIPLDYEYYIQKQLEGPLVKFFKLFMANPRELFEHARIQLHNQYNGFGRNGLLTYLSHNEKGTDNDINDDMDELVNRKRPIQSSSKKSKQPRPRPQPRIQKLFNC
jgi:DNA polymerase delta subunit 1